MSKKWKILGYQTKIEWYDIKTKFKQLLRKITYSNLFQEFICLLVASYMRLVYYSSRKVFINFDKLFDAAKDNKPLILCFWHNRLMMGPFLTRQTKKPYPHYKFMTLASNHGDGKIVSKAMEKLGCIPILGSSRDSRKPSRGISLSSFRQLFKGLKKGYALAITPDGPRGPNQKINGELLNIARLSGAGLLASSCSTSKFKQMNSWDKFKFPLPFSKLCYYLDDEVIYIDKDANEEELEKIKLNLEERMNIVQDKSFKAVVS